jgi:putative addiction module killer protein
MQGTVKMTLYTIYETDEYREWFSFETFKSQRQILNRVSKIEDEGHFGHHKNLDNGVFELKFNDGRRIYYALIPETTVILLLGGNKNGQDKDIKKAASILRKISKA